VASGYTKVQFGNVFLYRCTTRNISQQESLDQSNTDLKFMETTISVSGRMNGHVPGTPVGPASTPVWQYGLTEDSTGIDPAGNASTREQQIRRQLPPRQLFVMTVGTDWNGQGGNVLISAKPAPATMNPGGVGRIPGVQGPQESVAPVGMNVSNVDLRNGPHCTSFVITKIVGDECYDVEATFVICKIECDQYGNVPNNTKGVISNRWTCQDTMDANLRTSRVYTGQMCLTSANLNMQHLRWIVLPPIVPMMRRDSIQIVASEDGLRMDWSVTDVEIAMSAPYPARTWSVTHTNSARFAMFGESHIEVNLSGDSNVNKADLIELALYIITAKMFGTTPPNLNNLAVHPADFWSQFNVTNIELIDVIGDENRIVARASVKKTMDGQNGFAAIVGDIANTFGKPLGPGDLTTSAIARDGRPAYDRAFSWGGYAGDAPPYQSPAVSVVSIFACYLQSPCNDLHTTAAPPTGGVRSNIAGNQLSVEFNQTTAAPPTGGVRSNIAGNQLSVEFNQTPSQASQVPFNATIVSSLAPMDTPNPYISTNPLSKSNAYTWWQLENLYKTRTLKVALPTGGSPPAAGANFASTVSVVQLGQGISYRVVRVKAERVNKEPQFPDGNMIPAPPGQSFYRDSDKIKQTLVKTTIRACTPTQTPMGQTIYRSEAEYVLVLNRPLNPGEQLALGNDMWSILGSQATAVDGTLTESNWS